jgi:hypothetical protein
MVMAPNKGIPLKEAENGEEYTVTPISAKCGNYNYYFYYAMFNQKYSNFSGL